MPRHELEVGDVSQLAVGDVIALKGPSVPKEYEDRLFRVDAIKTDGHVDLSFLGPHKDHGEQ